MESCFVSEVSWSITDVTNFSLFVYAVQMDTSEVEDLESETQAILSIILQFWQVNYLNEGIVNKDDLLIYQSEQNANRDSISSTNEQEPVEGKQKQDLTENVVPTNVVPLETQEDIAQETSIINTDANQIIEEISNQDVIESVPSNQAAVESVPSNEAAVESVPSNQAVVESVSESEQLKYRIVTPGLISTEFETGSVYRTPKTFIKRKYVDARLKVDGSWNFHTLLRDYNKETRTLTYQTIFCKPTMENPIPKATVSVWFTFHKTVGTQSERTQWEVEYRYEHTHHTHKLTLSKSAYTRGFTTRERDLLKTQCELLANPLKRLSEVIKSKKDAADRIEQNNLFSADKLQRSSKFHPSSRLVGLEI
ncbi:hypothetical protein BC833DRAFT_616395 [Globomyces pollinis-pini]|nr:hypothetical protein BC833DRAFT_616395 [Globomyces pollinis-pini]